METWSIIATPFAFQATQMFVEDMSSGNRGVSHLAQATSQAETA
jgi:hypothetical protein